MPLERAPRPGMEWGEERELLTHLLEHTDVPWQESSIVHIRGTVQGHAGVALWAEPKLTRHLELFCARPVPEEGIDHHIPYEVHPLLCDTLALQVLYPRGLSHEEEIGEEIGHDPVDLLGHTSVETPEARLDMCQWYPRLGGDECSGEGRVHIAYY